MAHERFVFDGVLVIGAGLAGLSAALSAAPRPTLILAASELGEGCASAWAQGGMAAALAHDDSSGAHAVDTLAAAAGLAEPSLAAILAAEAPAAVRWLASIGVPFERRADGTFAQGLEAAHSCARIARVGGDGAGRAIMATLIGAARSAAHIQIREGWRALRLIEDGSDRVAGVLVRRKDGRLVEIVSHAVVLATGGAGALYAVTTNPREALGEGLAMAALAGAEVRDAEFVQFHPTAIVIGVDPAPLATEALRGEGARLVDGRGITFMAARHGASDLAPRDIVARAVAAEIASGAGAFLDARERPGGGIAREFPTVFSACMAGGLDPRSEPIPIAPAAHFHMGGIAVDSLGRSSLDGLFVVGEAACSGVHGANRLASNSLVEAAVFGARAGRAAALRARPRSALAARAPHPNRGLPATLLVELRRRMSEGAGVVREAEGLTSLLTWIDGARKDFADALPLVAARLIASAALARQESLGAHFRSDFHQRAARPVSSRTRLAGAAADLAA
ncbi:MAG: L-aspartate oxidase [Caulobacteraceae bacterium]